MRQLPPHDPPPWKAMFVMNSYSLSHLSDFVLLRDLANLVARDRVTTADMLAHIAEVDSRKLYLSAAYPSMFAYCVHELRLSEDAAYKRIQAARSARQFPAVLGALADGRLHLGAVCLLAPHLAAENVDDLLKAATHRPKAEIELLLASRFPRTELLPVVHVIPGSSRHDVQLAPGQVETCVAQRSGDVATHLAPGQVGAALPRVKLAPIAFERFSLQVSIGQGTHDKLRHAQALLSHQVPSGDLAELLDRALDALIGQLEKRKFSAADTPRTKQRPTKSHRHIPAHVQREVWERDQSQCTFVSEAGKRCPSRARLEFDHILEVSRGGGATVDNLRLLCRAHNQHAAELKFGTEFMKSKRDEARRTSAGRRLQAPELTRSAAEQVKCDVTPWLRKLGYNERDARRAASECADMLGASLEQKLRAALRLLCPPAKCIKPSAPTSVSSSIERAREDRTLRASAPSPC